MLARLVEQLERCRYKQRQCLRQKRKAVNSHLAASPLRQCRAHVEAVLGLDVGSWLRPISLHPAYGAIKGSCTGWRVYIGAAA